MKGQQKQFVPFFFCSNWNDLTFFALSSADKIPKHVAVPMPLDNESDFEDGCRYQARIQLSTGENDLNSLKVLFVPTVLVMLEFACLVDWIDESALLSPVGVVVWTLFSQNGWTFIPDYCNNTLAFVSYGPAQQFDTFRLQSQANSREERHSSNMYRCHRSRDSTTRPESKYHWKNISLS